MIIMMVIKNFETKFSSLHNCVLILTFLESKETQNFRAFGLKIYEIDNFHYTDHLMILFFEEEALG